MVSEVSVHYQDFWASGDGGGSGKGGESSGSRGCVWVVVITDGNPEEHVAEKPNNLMVREWGEWKGKTPRIFFKNMTQWPRDLITGPISYRFNHMTQS